MKLHSKTALTLALALVLASGAARAENGPAAETLFNDGKDLAARGRWAEACPKFEESQRLDPGIGTQFQLANCHERIGRLASAWSEFKDVAATAHAQGQAARERVARERARAIEGKLAYLTLDVEQPDVAGLVVLRDGASIGKPQWGSAIPIDAGEHRIEARAPARTAWQHTLRLDDGQRLLVRVPALRTEVAAPPTPAPVALAPVAPAPVAPAPVAPAPVTPPSTEPPPAALPETPATTVSQTEPPREAARGNGQRTAGAVVFGLGALSAGVGVVFGVLSKTAHDEADSHCRTDTLCDARGVELRHDAITKGNISTVAFAVGAVGLAGGAVLWLTAKKAPHTSARAALEPSFAADGAGIRLRGGF
jgi:hypothetical protein